MGVTARFCHFHQQTKIQEIMRLIASQIPGLRNLWKKADNIINKGKSSIPSLFKGSDVLLSASDRQSCLLKSF